MKERLRAGHSGAGLAGAGLAGAGLAGSAAGGAGLAGGAAGLADRSGAGALAKASLARHRRRRGRRIRGGPRKQSTGGASEAPGAGAAGRATGAGEGAGGATAAVDAVGVALTGAGAAGGAATGAGAGGVAAAAGAAAGTAGGGCGAGAGGFCGGVDCSAVASFAADAGRAASAFGEALALIGNEPTVVTSAIVAAPPKYQASEGRPSGAQGVRAQLGGSGQLGNALVLP